MNRPFSYNWSSCTVAFPTGPEVMLVQACGGEGRDGGVGHLMHAQIINLIGSSGTEPRQSNQTQRQHTSTRGIILDTPAPLSVCCLFFPVTFFHYDFSVWTLGCLICLCSYKKGVNETADEFVCMWVVSWKERTAMKVLQCEWKWTVKVCTSSLTEITIC